MNGATHPDQPTPGNSHPTTSEDEGSASWSLATGTLPWDSPLEPPGEESSSRPTVTGPPADPYARPVHAQSGYPYATWWRRFTAFMIDGAVVTVAWIAFWAALGSGYSSGRSAYLLADVVGGAYFTILSAGYRGQTPGMRATGIAVRARLGGGAIGYRSAIIRSVAMSLLAAPAMVLFALDTLVALFQRDRQALHDMVAGTVVVDVRHGKATDPTPFRSTVPAGARSESGDRGPRRARQFRALSGPGRFIATRSSRFIATRSSRFWIVLAAVAALAVAATVAIGAVRSYHATQHSPQKAAVDFLHALSAANTAALMRQTGLVIPAAVAPATNLLVTRADIATELAAPGNRIGQVSDVLVASAKKTAAGTATVALTYHADNSVHQVTFSLITSASAPTGWVVRIVPARLDIDVPMGDTRVTLDSIPLKLDGQVAHVYLFPTIATVAVPPSAIWQAATTTVDATHEDPNGDPRNVSFPDKLLPAAQESAIQAVTDQIDNCLAATTLTPANCPNADTPSGSGDTYSGITWSGLGAPTAGMTASVAPSGAVSVSGSMTAEVTYTDTTAGSSFFGSVSNQATDGPWNLFFTYPLTWSGSGWALGTVSVSNQPPDGQGSSSG